MRSVPATSPTAPLQPADRRWPDFLIYAGFALNGVATTILGPTLQWLKERWNLNDAQAAYVWVQYLGQLVGTIASDRVVARVGAKRCLAFGAALMGIGIAGLSAANWHLGLLFLFVNGLGIGLATPTTNLLVSHRHPQRRAAALSFVNLIWGIGAVVCPFVSGFFLHRGEGLRFLYIVSASMFLLMVLFLTLRETIATGGEEAHGAKVTVPLSTWCLFAAALFVYVGTETSVGGWSTVYTHRMDFSGNLSSVMPSFYWAGLLTGRALAPFILRYVSEFKVAVSGLVLGGAGVISLILARGIPSAIVSVVLAGLGFAAVFPIVVGWMTHRFGPTGNRLAGWAFVSASLGGAMLPWLLGQIANRAADMRVGYGVPLAGVIILLLLVPRASRLEASRLGPTSPGVP